MATNLGKVGMVTKGNWSSSATYEVLDVVYYNNGTYIAKQAVPANTAPTNTTYWQKALDSAIIGTTDISGIGDGTLTGAVVTLSDRIKRYSVPANDSLTVTGLPRAYIAATYGNGSAFLSIVAGVGYGNDAIRHKIGNIVAPSSSITIAPTSSGYGLVVTNGTATAVDLYITSLY